MLRPRQRAAVYAASVRGAVAAGNPHTAEAGAWALARGGSATDAIVAGAFSAFVAEGPLTGPAAGGFLLLREARQAPAVLDCFFAVPSRTGGQMDEVVIDFGDASTQVFHLGERSVAVPGLVAGLAEAHARHGRLPWSELFEPAIALAREGVELSEAQRFLLEILVPILERTPEGRSVYGSRTRAETAVMVPGLEHLRDAGPTAVCDLVPLLADDVASYRVIERPPLQCTFEGMTIVTCPPPSLGGAVVVAGLAELQRGPVELESGKERTDTSEVAAARALARSLVAGYGAAATRAALTGTTHMSVIDGDGNAAALSSTLGSGSGVFEGGFQHNNMLGELDVIGTTARVAGDRLPSMMTPTLVLDGNAPRLVVGSAGSVRLSGAILQVIRHVVAVGLSVAAAIDHPRIHVEDGVVQLEGGWSEEAAQTLEQDGHEVNRWAGRNLYFGGVSAVELVRGGDLAAAGDPRRGGHGVVVS